MSAEADREADLVATWLESESEDAAKLVGKAIAEGNRSLSDQEYQRMRCARQFARHIRERRHRGQ